MVDVAWSRAGRLGAAAAVVVAATALILWLRSESGEARHERVAAPAGTPAGNLALPPAETSSASGRSAGYLDPERLEELFGPARAPAAEALLGLVRGNRFDELAVRAEEEIARDPEFTLAWFQAGVAHARLGDYDRARQRLEVARDLARDGDPRLEPYYRTGRFVLAALED